METVSRNSACSSGSAARTDTEIQIRIPGELGIWIFIAGDLIVFAVFFILIALGQKESTETFFRSRQKLDLWVGVLNTLLLLTGSWFVAVAVERCREGACILASRYFSLGILCGVAFVANKGMEWGSKIAQGITPATNEFFMYFFVFTGIHLLHVLVGICVLFLLQRVSLRRSSNDRKIRLLESGACFWHLVDLLWIVLFALLYLL